jgi:hypothetical protein
MADASEALAMGFVIDNSVVAGWFLENQANEDTDAVARRLANERAAAPCV